MDVAEDVVSFMDSRLRPLSGVRWRERDHAVNQCSPSARKGAYILSMKIVSVASLPLSDVKVIRFARFMDDRGFTEPFRRSDFDTHPEMEFLRGQSFVQSNESYSRSNVVRGLHFQWNPYRKLVRTLHGRMVDIVLDIRKGSPSLGKAVLHDMPVSESALWSEWIWVPPGLLTATFSRPSRVSSTTMRQNTAPAVRQVCRHWPATSTGRSPIRP